MAENNPAEGKVPVYHQKTGEVVHYWPRDASEVVGAPGSEWSHTPPTDTPSAAKPKKKKAVAKKAAAKPKAKPKKRR